MDQPTVDNGGVSRRRVPPSPCYASLEVSYLLTSHIFFSKNTPYEAIFTELAHWADSVIKSQCPSVCLCVCDVLKHPGQKHIPNIWL